MTINEHPAVRVYATLGPVLNEQRSCQQEVGVSSETPQRLA